MKREQDWELQKYPAHDSFYRFMRELNEVYLTHSALSALDYSEYGFLWVDCHQEQKCVYAISRKSEGEELIAVFNFSDKEQSYTLPRTFAKEKFGVLLYTDWEKYGGQSSLLKDVWVGGTITLERSSGVLLMVLANT